jgi:hypothetical protein
MGSLRNLKRVKEPKEEPRVSKILVCRHCGKYLGPKETYICTWCSIKIDRIAYGLEE